MWCDRVVRNLADAPNPQPENRAVDFVDINWNQCGRVLKASTQSGQNIRVLLPPGQRLRHGDVIFENATTTVAINVRPCEVIVVADGSAKEMKLLALELGNLHWPTQITETEIVFPEDGPALEALAKSNVPWSRQTRRFAPAPVIGGPVVNLAEGFSVIRK